MVRMGRLAGDLGVIMSVGEGGLLRAASSETTELRAIMNKSVKNENLCAKEMAQDFWAVCPVCQFEYS